MTAREFRETVYGHFVHVVGHVIILQRSRCGSPMRLIAAIQDPTVARKILECLKLPW